MSPLRDRDPDIQERFEIVDGAVVSALASRHCGPGSIPARCHMWVEFVVGSSLAPSVFLRVLQFSSLLKTQHSTWMEDPLKNQL